MSTNHCPSISKFPCIEQCPKRLGHTWEEFDLSRLNVRWLSYGQFFLSSAVWMAGMLARTAMATFWFWRSTKDGKGGLKEVDQNSRNRLGQGWPDRLHANPSPFLHDPFCTRQTGTSILSYWYQFPSRWSQLHITQIVIRFFLTSLTTFLLLQCCIFNHLISTTLQSTHQLIYCKGLVGSLSPRVKCLHQEFHLDSAPTSTDPTLSGRFL